MIHVDKFILYDEKILKITQTKTKNKLSDHNISTVIKKTNIFKYFFYQQKNIIKLVEHLRGALTLIQKNLYDLMH